MPYYLTVANWTDQGIRNIKESPKRLDAAKALSATFGGKLEWFYYTMGKYDLAFVTSFPNDESAAKFLFSLGKLGNLKTDTMKAIPEAEGVKLINSL
ncbi:MAG TPA: GYD domain-containing protein [Conexivisphaerales archaeon]|nr:GYD domain-containing protein [Conexivisphaerales archaeon]